MKIIELGRSPADVKWYGKCSLCGAVLSAIGSELQHMEPPDQRSEAFAWEDCISCGGIRSACFHEADSASAQALYKKYV